MIRCVGRRAEDVSDYVIIQLCNLTAVVCIVCCMNIINIQYTVVYAIDDECDYCPDRALSAALHDWMEELNQPLQAGKT